MHGCKPCRAVYLLFECVQEQRTAVNLPVQIFLQQESGETEEESAQKMFVKEPRGVFLYSEGFESTKWREVGHDLT